MKDRWSHVKAEIPLPEAALEASRLASQQALAAIPQLEQRNSQCQTISRDGGKALPQCIVTAMLCNILPHSQLTCKGAKRAIAEGAAGSRCDEQERLLSVAHHSRAAGRQLDACAQPRASTK